MPKKAGMEENDEKTSTELASKTFKIEFSISDSVDSAFANEMAVQTLQSELIMTFFEIRIPFNPNDKEAKAKCVGRIIMPMAKALDIVSAIKNQHTQYTNQIEMINRQKEEKADG